MQGAGATSSHPAQCLIDDGIANPGTATPQLYAANRVVMPSNATDRSFSLKGIGFGSGTAGALTLANEDGGSSTSGTISSILTGGPANYSSVSSITSGTNIGGVATPGVNRTATAFNAGTGVLTISTAGGVGNLPTSAAAPTPLTGSTVSVYNAAGTTVVLTGTVASNTNNSITLQNVAGAYGAAGNRTVILNDVLTVSSVLGANNALAGKWLLWSPNGASGTNASNVGNAEAQILRSQTVGGTVWLTMDPATRAANAGFATAYPIAGRNSRIFANNAANTTLNAVITPGSGNWSGLAGRTLTVAGGLTATIQASNTTTITLNDASVASQKPPLRGAAFTLDPQVATVNGATFPTPNGLAGRTLTVTAGANVGATRLITANTTTTLTLTGGSGTVAAGDAFQIASSLDIPATAVGTTTWNDHEIDFSLPAGLAPGPYQLYITNGTSKQRSINAVTIHVTGSTYNPRIFDVDPSQPETASRKQTIQGAVNAAANVPATLPNTAPGDSVPGLNNTSAIIVVHPGTPGGFNPRGAYYENVVIPTALKLQGMGPGGDYPAGYAGALGDTSVLGSVIDGSLFGTKNGGRYRTSWYDLATYIQAATGNTSTLQDSAVITVLTGEKVLNSSGNRTSQDTFSSTFKAGIDGLRIEGGDSLELPGGLNTNGGGGPLPRRVQAIGQPEAQGGGIFVDTWARYLQIKNNLIRQNSGSVAGGIRVGSPSLADALGGNTGSSHNTNLRIANNQVDANGGFRVAGAIGLFNGSDNYEISRNEICGNYSAEYGGGISVFGFSPGGSIHHNRIYFNQSYDEGAGVMIAGQLPNPKVFPNLPPQAGLTQGSGSVTIDSNVIQSNIAGDDGGGLRFLMATGTGGTGANERHVVTNNFIVNNISAHEGGGIALDDTVNVQIVNDTIMNNLTTATAMTSNGDAAPAGISSGANSSQLQGLPGVTGSWTPPTITNTILWDNRAGRYDGSTVYGIGLHPTTTPANPDINNWDLGAQDGAGAMAPTYSDIQAATNGVAYTPAGTEQVGQPGREVGVRHERAARAVPR